MINKLLDRTELIHANYQLFKSRKLEPKSRFFILLKQSNKILKSRLLSQNDFVNYMLAYNKTRLKNMLVCRHPDLFFRVHPTCQKKKIILRWKILIYFWLKKFFWGMNIKKIFWPARFLSTRLGDGEPTYF